MFRLIVAILLIGSFAQAQFPPRKEGGDHGGGAYVPETLETARDMLDTYFIAIYWGFASARSNYRNPKPPPKTGYTNGADFAKSQLNSIASDFGPGSLLQGDINTFLELNPGRATVEPYAAKAKSQMTEMIPLLQKLAAMIKSGRGTEKEIDSGFADLDLKFKALRVNMQLLIGADPKKPFPPVQRGFYY